ncbi:maltokinase N-terminal cap-like domain-containing protein [Arthrobacter roseus]|uniref:maltokinase N-terminal cap-like domain-containing protein n=1 Tax=Arthrobacter roseus TaxID=136274 RepID=UPI003B83959E
MKLLAHWLPNQPWFRKSGPTNLGRVGSFRFDDPDGEVGIETLILKSESAVFQVPLTYRSCPLEDADPCLIGTLEHSFLGKR